MDSEIQVVETCLVAPSEATPRKRLWLSPLDFLLTNRIHTPTVHFYRSGDGAADDFFDVGRLKAAMAKALVSFYPLAGRLDIDDNGRWEISCNGEGALFVVARSNLSVNEFNHIKPSPKLRRLFIPRIEPSSIVMAIQVTFLKCGGVALGSALHHFCVDGKSASHFFDTWSAYCRDGDRADVDAPCHNRTLLRARSPPVINPEYRFVICPTPMLTEPSGPMSCEFFSISKDQLASVKKLCGGATTFCAMSALVWQSILMARRLAPEAKTRVMFPANVRRMMKPPLSYNYFGNAVIFLASASTVRDITSEPLYSTACSISGLIGQVDDGLVRSAVDCHALAERDNLTLKDTGTIPETDLVMVSWLGMPLYDIDFGWGKAKVMSRAESLLGGFVYLMNGKPEDDDGSCAIRVLACMETANMKEFERLLYAQL
ncbi:hypothetical protein PR202_ga22181 [Eleusine coracana subsp. coracana]|uniref:Uncharacterized protein n=1 Tax=Eleusine coracana subsp. coracana TaxID=191504 RepID=A0AAV5D2U6_ELECO|nr:hypothetical protein QOZ80_9AG0685490 [Eleusine coracana subsp. coracana]GJN04617.1 hypothetical protein PR202_ga22181 [Eleusine coracana subsp. coracana]